MQRNEIEHTQLALITVAGFSIMSLFGFPGDLVGEAGLASGVVIAATWILVLLSAFLILRLAVRFPGQTVTEYSQAILGRPLGLLLLVALAGFHLFVAALIVESYSRVIHTIFLPRTPELVVLVAMVLVAAYIASLGLQSIGRTCELLIPVVYAVFLILLAIGVTRVEPLHLRPSLAEGWRPVLMGITRVFYPFLAPQALYLLPAFLSQPPRRTQPWALMAVAANIALVTAIYLLTVGILGVDTPRRVKFPGIFAIQLLFVPGFFIENVGYTVAVAWTVLICLYLSFQLWGQSLVTSRVLGLSPRYLPVVLIVLTAILLLIRQLIAGQRNLDIVFTTYVSPAGLIVSLGFPILLLLVALIRGIRGPADDRRHRRLPARAEAVKVRRDED